MIKATLEDLNREFWLRARNQGLIQWTMKNGEKIAIKDMSDSHLINTINMIIRNKDAYEEYWDAYESYLSNMND